MQLPDWPNYSVEEVSIVRDVLESGQVNYWTGPHGKAFEQEYAQYCGVDFGIAVANGSVGLSAALTALGIGRGDEVVVTPRSFIASASAIALAGAIPVFAEVDSNSQNITADSIRSVLTDRTRAITCVHLAGWPCAMPEIVALAKDHGLAVIEDCAQAHGARIAGRSAGAWGDIGVFSFCQDKIITTGGEGGMLVTNHRDLWEKLWAYKDHGKSYAAVYAKDHESGFRWLHESLGTNLRMTEMQAAMGRWQLRQLDNWVITRRNNARLLERSLEDLDCVRISRPNDDVYHSYYKYYVFVRPDLLKKSWNRDRIISEFAKLGIPGLSGSCPEIYLEKAFANSPSVPPTRLPVARMLGETSIIFQVHPGLEEQHINYVADKAKQVFKQAQAS